MIRTIPFVIALLFFTLAGGAATAKLPEYTNPPAFTSHRIVEGVSLGGLKLGMSKARAVAVWGQPDGKCRRVYTYDSDRQERSCHYGGFVQTRKEKESRAPFAGFVYLSGEVIQVSISATKYPGRNPVLVRPYQMAARQLKGFKTGKGIRLRSTLEAARRAYGLPTPQNIPDHRRDDFFRSVVARQPGACTVFGWSGSRPLYTFVDYIEISVAASCPAEPTPVAPPPE